MKAGFIGLGLMGARMAANLAAKGFDLTVHNRTPSRAEALVAAGAKWAASPAEAAGSSDVVFTMLSTPRAVEETALGDAGLLDGLRPGALWVDCTTVNPSFSRAMAERTRRRGARFIDAPVAGSTAPAEKGELVFLVGGDVGDVEGCRPLLAAMGRKVVHTGAEGTGSAMKMAVNVMLAAGMAVLAEALALGGSLGLRRELLLDTLLSLPVAPPFLAGKRGKIENGEFSAEFPLQWMQKDLHLAAATAFEERVALPVTNAMKELYQMASRAGMAEEDFSAVCRFLAGAKSPEDRESPKTSP